MSRTTPATDFDMPIPMEVFLAYAKSKGREIVLTWESWDQNPNMIDLGAGMDNYRCLLWIKNKSEPGRGWARKQMLTYYSKGSGHHGKPPTAVEVIDALASDSQSVEGCGSFEGWAKDLGFDTDSRKAEATYQICVKQMRALRALLGAHLFDVLLYHTDRL